MLFLGLGGCVLASSFRIESRAEPGRLDSPGLHIDLSRRLMLPNSYRRDVRTSTPEPQIERPEHRNASGLRVVTLAEKFMPYIQATAATLARTNPSISADDLEQEAYLALLEYDRQNRAVSVKDYAGFAMKRFIRREHLEARSKGRRPSPRSRSTKPSL
jgi:hypothetical protein